MFFNYTFKFWTFYNIIFCRLSIYLFLISGFSFWFFLSSTEWFLFGSSFSKSVKSSQFKIISKSWICWYIRQNKLHFKLLSFYLEVIYTNRYTYIWPLQVGSIFPLIAFWKIKTSLFLKNDLVNSKLIRIYPIPCIVLPNGSWPSHPDNLSDFI